MCLQSGRTGFCQYSSCTERKRTAFGAFNDFSVCEHRVISRHVENWSQQTDLKITCFDYHLVSDKVCGPVSQTYLNDISSNIYANSSQLRSVYQSKASSCVDLCHNASSPSCPSTVTISRQDTAFSTWWHGLILWLTLGADRNLTVSKTNYQRRPAWSQVRYKRICAKQHFLDGTTDQHSYLSCTSNFCKYS